MLFNLSSRKAGQNRSVWPPYSTSAFSLIEVTLAMGIVSVAFITIMGLLTTALNTFHDSVATTICTQIGQEVVNSVQQTDFNQLTTQGNQTYYFDDQGNQLNTANKTQAVYQVNVTVASPTTLPGATATNVNLATVGVQVVRYPAGTAVATYSTQVAKDY